MRQCQEKRWECRLELRETRSMLRMRYAEHTSVFYAQGCTHGRVRLCTRVGAYASRA